MRFVIVAHRVQVREAGIGVCSGGIIGMGEGETDRVGLLHSLATLKQHPESVPINALVPVEGTPLAKQVNWLMFKSPPMICNSYLSHCITLLKCWA